MGSRSPAKEIRTILGKLFMITLFKASGMFVSVYKWLLYSFPEVMIPGRPARSSTYLLDVQQVDLEIVSGLLSLFEI